MIPEINITLSTMPPGQVFGLDMQTFRQVLAHIVTVGVLAFVLTKLLYKPIRGFLANRAEKIQSQLDTAATEVEKANALREEYESKLREIDTTRNEILEQARLQAAEAGERMTNEARAEADQIRDRAKADIAMEREQARTEMKHAIIDVSALMASKFMSNTIDRSTHDNLFEETMSELEGSPWQS